MAAKKQCCVSGKKELSSAKETIKKLEKELSSLKSSYAKDIAVLIEEAYMAGYSDAIVDFDKKADAMEKFLHKSLGDFEKNYRKNVLAVSPEPRKRAKKNKKKR